MTRNSSPAFLLPKGELCHPSGIKWFIVVDPDPRAGQTRKFSRLSASDAKEFCWRDGRRHDCDENDANAKDATYYGREISHILKRKDSAKYKTTTSFSMKIWQ